MTLFLEERPWTTSSWLCDTPSVLASRRTTAALAFPSSEAAVTRRRKTSSRKPNVWFPDALGCTLTRIVVCGDETTAATLHNPEVLKLVY